MDAAGTSRWANSAGAVESTRLLRAAVTSGMSLLALAGCVLVVRRFSGALVSPPPAAALALVGLVLAAAGLGFRRLLADGVLAAHVRPAVYALPGGVAVLWLAALSLPETSGWGLTLLFGPVLLAEGFSWGRFARRAAEADRLVPAATAILPPAAAESPAQSHELAETSLADEEPLERDENALGEQTRRRDAETGEIIEGWLRVDFATGQRHAAAHIAICPPLERNPTCYAEPADGPDASVKITQAMSYGVRLELKLAEPAAEPASVIVEYSIFEHAAAGE